MLEIKKVTWEEIVSSYMNNPRDVKTIPLKGEGIWFYVYVENGNIYVENAKNHLTSSKIKIRRKIKKENFDKMVSLYYRRTKGESVSREATEITYNQVYWFGILADT
ncbi:MAG: hypothetical protein IKB60_01465 [Clostridia bacterium]|nr:hypothetical protein [Clostridia bacterium]